MRAPVIFAFMIMVSAAGTALSLDSHLLLYDSLNSNMSIQDNGGIASGVTFNSGQVDSAAGIEGHIDYPYTNHFEPSAGTIQFLVKPNDMGDMGLIEVGRLGFANSLGIFRITRWGRTIAALEVRKNDSSYLQAWHDTDKARLENDTWCLVTAVWQCNSGTHDFFQLYINDIPGYRHSASVCTDFAEPSTTHIRLGSTYWYGDGVGEYDELKIFDYAKSESEIRQDYKEIFGTLNEFGSLKVMLGPAEAVSAGAQWNVDGNAWQKSAVTVTDLSVGSHTVNYSPISGWNTPPSETVTIKDGKTTSITRKYVSGPESVAFTGINGAYRHIYEVMDKYHKTYDVYTDLSAAGNHFVTYGKLPDDKDDVAINPSSKISPHSGDTCIENRFVANGDNWGGWYFMNGVLEGVEAKPKPNWGEYPDAGINLAGAAQLTFWARGAEGGEHVEFFALGVGRNAKTGKSETSYPDSSRRISLGYKVLNIDWKKYTINLTGRDLSYVLGGIGWVTNSPRNHKQDIIFYLDDIRYSKSRLDESRFLVSYETIPSSNDFDVVLKNVAFTYDNALALIALLARGTEIDKKRARLIADAFVYAINNDRFFKDGRLRDTYQGGDLVLPSGWTPNGNANTVRMTGWWNDAYDTWYESKGFVGSSTGNVAWAMIALLSYYEEIGGDQYLNAAEDLGEWIERETRDGRGEGGYTGGYEGWEATSNNPLGQTKFLWKSTEHNIDVYVAFKRLNQLTGKADWLNRSLYAKKFVESMWNTNEGHFWTGTLDDGITINKSTIPLDIQAWAVMAMDGYNSALGWAENNCYTEADGFSGFDFNNDRDGVWFEGTAQMAVAYQINGQSDKANLYLSELLKAQQSAINSNGKGIVAASYDGLTTGFGWEYFSRLHIGATAWYTYAGMEYNPYWNIRMNPLIPMELDIIPLTVSKCAIKLSNTQGLASFSAFGTFAQSPPDLSYIDQIDVNIVSLSGNILIYKESIGFDISKVIKEKFRYTHKVSGAINSLIIDFNKRTVAMKANGIDLKGLDCPFQLEITFGNCALSGEVDEEILNGSKPLPVQLMMGVKDTLSITRSKVTFGKKPNTDSFTAQGTFTLAGDYNKSYPMVITLGTQTFTVSGDKFNYMDKQHVESCKKADSVEGAIVDAKFDFVKCTYSISVKNTKIAQTGPADFGIDVFGNVLSGESINIP